MKIYLDLEQFDSIRDPYTQSSEGIMRVSGFNIGNFAFRHALRFLVPDLEDYRVVNWLEAIKLIDQNVHVEKAILSCANWLGFSEKDERDNLVRAQTLEALDAQIIAFGLGAQASLNATGLKLGENTKRLARIISKKSNTISVRDELTKSILSGCGVDNVVVTGCPSNIINQSSDFFNELEKKSLLSLQMAPEKRKVISSEYGGGNKDSGAVIKKTFQVLEKCPSFYVIQSPELLPFYLSEELDVPSAYKANKPNSMTDDMLFDLLKQKTIGFSSVDAWMDFSRTSNLSFGMRIHGNIIPLQAGVPSVLIAHDSRTFGLAETMSIPSISTSEFLSTEASDLTELMLLRFNEGLRGYIEKRSYLTSVLENFVEENLKGE